MTTMQALEWIRRWPLASYFLLAFAFSWAIMVPLVLGSYGLVPTVEPIPLLILMGYGPTFAALVVSATVGGRAAVGGLLRAATHLAGRVAVVGGGAVRQWPDRGGSARGLRVAGELAPGPTGAGATAPAAGCPDVRHQWGGERGGDRVAGVRDAATARALWDGGDRRGAGCNRDDLSPADLLQQWRVGGGGAGGHAVSRRSL